MDLFTMWLFREELIQNVLAEVNSEFRVTALLRKSNPPHNEVQGETHFEIVTTNQKG